MRRKSNSLQRDMVSFLPQRPWDYFDKLGVKYIDKDVEKDPANGLEAK